MDIPTIYTVAYVIPAALAFSASHFLSGDPKGHRRGAFVHAALLASIVASQAAILVSPSKFPWSLSQLDTVVILSSLVVVGLLLGSVGLLYAASAFVQELTICSIVLLLASEISVLATAMLVVPGFVATHKLDRTHLYARVILLGCWGTTSVGLFWITHNVYVITALHIVLGGMLIHVGVLHPVACTDTRRRLPQSSAIPKSTAGAEHRIRNGVAEPH